VVVNVVLLIVGIVDGVALGYWLAYYAIGLLPMLLIAAVLTGAALVYLNVGRR
jgi:F0F1-type ATP synthase assembly protein I